MHVRVLHACMHTYIHTYRSYIHTCMHTYRSYIRIFIHTCIHTYIQIIHTDHEHIYTYIHTHIYTWPCKPSSASPWAANYLPSGHHTYADTYIHTYSHAHPRWLRRRLQTTFQHGRCHRTLPRKRARENRHGFGGTCIRRRRDVCVCGRNGCA